jgi:plasmid maintenance system killer protein
MPHCTTSDDMNNDHGRIENRKCIALPLMPFMVLESKWKGLQSAVLIESERQVNQKKVLNSVIILAYWPHNLYDGITSNHLKKLIGNKKDFWSIRLNDQYRVIFKWDNGEAIDVDVEDYH